MPFRIFEDARTLRALPTQEERDAAAIRLGYQITGPQQYSRQTGASVAQVVAGIGTIVPAVGPALGAVARTVGAVRDAVKPQTSLQQPGSAPSAPSASSSYSAPSGPAQQAAFGGAGVLFLLIGAAVFLLFGKRGR